jgi:hypothetical protein
VGARRAQTNRCPCWTILVGRQRPLQRSLWQQVQCGAQLGSTQHMLWAAQARRVAEVVGDDHGRIQLHGHRWQFTSKDKKNSNHHMKEAKSLACSAIPKASGAITFPPNNDGKLHRLGLRFQSRCHLSAFQRATVIHSPIESPAPPPELHKTVTQAPSPAAWLPWPAASPPAMQPREKEKSTRWLSSHGSRHMDARAPRRRQPGPGLSTCSFVGVSRR